MAVHLLLDLYNCDADVLNKKADLVSLITEIANFYEMEILDTSAHKFEPQGVTALHLLGESHISIHTWPENNYAAVDFFSCRQVDFQEAIEKFQKRLKAKDLKFQVIDRFITFINS